jgi:serine/threonine protein kinase
VVGLCTVNSCLFGGEARIAENRLACCSCRYIVKDMLGQGTFGQVAKCWKEDTEEYVAVKVIKNQPAYYHQAFVEISVLKTVRNAP